MLILKNQLHSFITMLRSLLSIISHESSEWYSSMDLSAVSSSEALSDSPPVPVSGRPGIENQAL